jgi:hypothetical protein
MTDLSYRSVRSRFRTPDSAVFDDDVDMLHCDDVGEWIAVDDDDVIRDLIIEFRADRGNATVFKNDDRMMNGLCFIAVQQHATNEGNRPIRPQSFLSESIACRGRGENAYKYVSHFLRPRFLPL